jgi:predicted metal-dependent RNase
MDVMLMPLGAGQEVGRSCIMVNASGVSVMLDCGVHLGHRDARRLPDFDVVRGGGAGDITAAMQAVVITHFHLDHIGALPYLTEVVGYRGPIIMTRATQQLAQLMLEDYVGLSKEKCDAVCWFVMTRLHFDLCAHMLLPPPRTCARAPLRARTLASALSNVAVKI